MGKATPPSYINLPYLEELYARYQRDPQSVGSEWQQYFREITDGEPSTAELPQVPFSHYSIFDPPRGRSRTAGVADGRFAGLQERVDSLSRSYRARGHMVARVDPLQQPKESPPELELSFHGLQDADLDCEFSCGSMEPNRLLPLREIVQRLRNTYCRSIGVQFMHIDDFSVRIWLQERMERSQNRVQLHRDEQIRILTRLTDAVVFEEFIRRKFMGAKSFSLEGSESLIPLLDLAIERAGEHGVEDIVIGMAHRGRLNVLANILGKSPREIFREFEDLDTERHLKGGDVKYHLGHTGQWTTATRRKLNLTLCFNPSHLEFVNPVAAGRTRARQDLRDDADRTRSMLVLIHGDAACIGQGVVQEVLNLSRLPGYRVGGALHVVVNNQIGFTTRPTQGRSTMYATSVAKMLPAPIFHVNGEDPEAVAQCVQLALEFRARFKQDVVLDMYGYRRLGHNESDEPSFTQPMMYRRIRDRKPVREGYLEHLLALGEVTREEADEIARRRHELLDKNLAEARSKASQRLATGLPPIWKHYSGGPEPEDEQIEPPPGKEKLAELLESQTRWPDDFHPHPKLRKLAESRRKMARGEQPLDWSAAESLAFAALATRGIRVRLSGQDSQRGTFSQRHAVLHDVEDGHLYMPLQHLDARQARVEIHNSPLSETGVLGFDYGYSLEAPEALILWEAQFGDFVNAAQVIVDQFIVSAEKKWGQLSGLVLLLPHGFEGQGPEHSSGRLERFLQLAAEDNIQVVNPTTPAQYFHCLRRQALRPWRKPLVIMTPKSLLRHASATSTLDELAAGSFQKVLADPLHESSRTSRRVLLCSGKLFYELAEHRQNTSRQDVAILRVEQLYPLRSSTLETALASYPEHTPVYWVQEEPQNMGAWWYLRTRFGEELFGRPFACVSRPESASPGTGSAKAHKLEQSRIVAEAFGE